MWKKWLTRKLCLPLTPCPGMSSSLLWWRSRTGGSGTLPTPSWRAGWRQWSWSSMPGWVRLATKKLSGGKSLTQPWPGSRSWSRKRRKEEDIYIGIKMRLLKTVKRIKRREVNLVSSNSSGTTPTSRCRICQGLSWPPRWSKDWPLTQTSRTWRCWWRRLTGLSWRP